MNPPHAPRCDAPLDVELDRVQVPPRCPGHMIAVDAETHRCDSCGREELTAQGHINASRRLLQQAKEERK